MRKLIAILGGFSLMSSAAIGTVGCVDDQNDVFVLKTDIGEVIDTFNKKEVVDYHFNWWGWGWVGGMTEIVINFKDSGLKNYGQKPGGIDFFLDQLISGLSMKPDQEKYNARDIPPAVWQNAGWWDYDNNRPSFTTQKFYRGAKLLLIKI